MICIIVAAALAVSIVAMMMARKMKPVVPFQPVFVPTPATAPAAPHEAFDVVYPSGPHAGPFSQYWTEKVNTMF